MDLHRCRLNWCWSRCRSWLHNGLSTHDGVDLSDVHYTLPTSWLLHRLLVLMARLYWLLMLMSLVLLNRRRVRVSRLRRRSLLYRRRSGLHWLLMVRSYRLLSRSRLRGRLLLLCSILGLLCLRVKLLLLLLLRPLCHLSLLHPLGFHSDIMG